MMPYVYFDDAIVDDHNAKLSIDSQSVQYGLTAFGGMRGYYQKDHIRIFRLRDHFERLLTAAHTLGMSFQMDFTNFSEIIQQLIEKNGVKQDIYIRPFLYTNSNSLRPKFDDRPFQLAIYFVPFSNFIPFDKGLNVMISSWRKTPDASIPSKAKAGGGYLNSALATSQAIRCGYDEALVMNENWNIVEASVANIFAEYRGDIITPSINNDVLEGITFRTAVTLLKDMGHNILFDTLDRSILYGAGEVFLTGTAMQLVFINSIDSVVIGDISHRPPPIYTKLKEYFHMILEGKKSKYKEWLFDFSTK